MKAVIIDYNAGNIRSVENALKRLNVEPVITADKQLIRHADKVIFPGVGEAATTMSFLQERGLDVLIKSLTQPVLGICLGMQLMCRYSEEGATNCLGIFDTEVKRFESLRHEDKVPHMGWNTIYNLQNNMKVVDGGMKPGSCLFKGVADNSYVYLFIVIMCQLTTILLLPLTISNHSVPLFRKITFLPLSSTLKKVAL